MTEKIYIEYYNDVYVHVICDQGIAFELKERFTFFVDGYQFMPKYKQGRWSGQIHLFNPRSGLLYGGLTYELENFAKDNDYEIEYMYDNSADEFSEFEAREFIKKLHLPDHIEVRDYQLFSFIHAVRHRRALYLSPTSSGKSLIIYLITRYMLSLKRKTLIVVPSTNLIHQMAGDFREYNFDSETFIHKIHDGKEVSKKPVTITTWQSVYKFEEDWFESFGAILVDEAHLAAAKSLIGIMEKCPNIPYRFGLTGTTDEAKESSELTLQGLFGQKKNVTTTAKLMEDGHVAQLTIKAIVLKHPEERCKELAKNKEYMHEIDTLIGCESRNKFIKNLALSLKGNTMILYSRVAKHGEILHDMFLEEELGDRHVYFVAGSGDRKMSGKERDDLRAIVEKETDAIIIASYGTLSTGYSIKNLSNVIFASPRKTKIGNIQSIGRALRVNETKKSATVFDIADDLCHKTYKNHTLRHFVERMKLYSKEKFDFRNYLVKLQS